MKTATRQQNAYTLIELLMAIFITALATVAYTAVRPKHGPWLAAAAAALAVVVGVTLVVLFYRWSWRRDRRQLAELREKFCTIYQVKTLPTASASIVKPEWAEIQIGDYGWDARPGQRDGLIHLQGLTKQWQVVWHAGFRPDQIEKVAEKPSSQYDYWVPYWSRRPPPPPCPFPIRERNTPTMGLPHHSGRYSKNYPAAYYLSPGIDAPQPRPVMTAAQFTSWRKAPQRQYLIWILVLALPMLFGISHLCSYMDRAKPAMWIQILAACALFAALALFLILPGRMMKLAAKNRGFQCPVCGNKITVYGGLAGWPRMNLCNRCGTQVIESGGPQRKPTAHLGDRP